MHDTALDLGGKFFVTYASNKTGLLIVDVGAQDVNGSLRSLAPNGNKFVGVDFVEGKGVDVILTDPYSLPFDDESVDICVTSSVFEHSEFFWLLFNEILRILKPSGIVYINAPSNGYIHRYPVDCWRFYPDSGKALQNWARKSGFNTVLLESFTGKQNKDVWNDYVAVFLKDEKFIDKYPVRMLDSITDYTNGITHEKPDFLKFTGLPEDYSILSWVYVRRNIKKYLDKLKKVLLGR